jgi:hypothetical protein
MGEDVCTICGQPLVFGTCLEFASDISAFRELLAELERQCRANAAECRAKAEELPRNQNV